MPTLFECSTCQTVKPSTEFSPHKCAKNGFNPRCKECCRNLARAKHLEKRGGVLGKPGRKRVNTEKTESRVPSEAERKAAKMEQIKARGEAALWRWRMTL